MRKIPRFATALLLAAMAYCTGGMSVSHAQVTTGTSPKNITVKGKIRDGKNIPLPGVTVRVKGSTKGTVSDEKGTFSIPDVDPQSVLVVQFIGYEQQEYNVNGSTSVSILLKETEKQLDEYVVTGYGTTKKVTKTGSVSTVKGSEIKQAPTVNISNALVGRVSGLMAINSSGEPGYDGSRILIRGRSTFNNSDPLVVIDGIPRDGFQRLNPNDIENVSVLKDASAAIFGSRAANGVILITTKRGRTGKPLLSYSFNQGLTQPTRLPKMADAPTYARIVNEINVNAGDQPSFSEERIKKFADGSDPWGHPNTDWIDEVVKPLSGQNRHDLSLRGGSDKFVYYVSLGTLFQDGIFKKSATKYRQHNIRINLDANVNKYLTVRMDVAGRLEDRNFPPRSAGSIFRALLRGRPTEAARWPNGLPGPDIEYGDNPVVTSTNEIGYQRDRTYVINSNLGVVLYIPKVDGLFLDANFALDQNFNFQKRFIKPWTLYTYQGMDANGQPKLEASKRGVNAPELEEWYGQNQNVTLNAKINYIKSFGKHNVTGILAVEQNTNKGDNFWARRRYFISGAVDQLFAGSNEEKDNTGRAFDYARLNYFGRVSYNYDEKYLFDFNWRYDGSQNFPSGRRFGFFPGVSAGWVVSRENFWKSAMGTTIDYFKLRGSYGQMGNDLVNPFQYMNTFGIADGGSVFGDKLNQGIYTLRIPNPGITWEVSHNLDLAVEAKFFNGLIAVEAEYFRTNRSSILTKRSASVPIYTGLTLPDENIGKVQNQGVDLNISHKRTVNKFKYEIVANVSHAKNKIVFWDEVPNVPEWQRSTGRQIGAALYYEATGIFKNKEEIEKYPHVGGAVPGDVIFRDVNNDGQINDLDRVRVNRSEYPLWNYGLTLGAEFHNFDLTMLWQAATGSSQYIRTESGLIGNFPMRIVEDRWTPQNPNGSMPRPYDRDKEYWVSRPNTFWLWNTNYLRLKTLELGYTIPQTLRKKAGLEDLRVYVSGQNLLTFDKVKIFDPESPTGSGQYYPQTRIFNAGLNVTF
ncbi:TonB-dependent receptor [Chitinophaga lutea]|uniref:TonB-dependent receptor n=1 Tax=Chitinophaga lutea TaxID=2488634 RepID=A0A3N4Q0H3_9BACT|nr:TonB-dependent receptor [Chitinophaga lutea]RPE13718.1 TonB-dependent receptor [Chitinophaga lutea]